MLFAPIAQSGHRNALCLRIPYALDDSGAMVRPSDAWRGVSCRCPECRTRLIFRRGPRRAPHFAHPAHASGCRFLGEGCRHLAAKHAILMSVRRWKRRLDDAPTIWRVCRVCAEEREQPLPAKVAAAALEHPIGWNLKGEGIVADVALLDRRDGVVAVVEVRDSHGVDEAKRTRFHGLPWLEVDAREVLGNPQLWKPIQSGNLRKMPCRCDGATKMPVIRRGRTLHVDGCPRRSRVWRGKPYANVRRDCGDCPHCVGMEKEPGSGAKALVGALYCAAPRAGSG